MTSSAEDILQELYDYSYDGDITEVPRILTDNAPSVFADMDPSDLADAFEEFSYIPLWASVDPQEYQDTLTLFMSKAATYIPDFYSDYVPELLINLLDASAGYAAENNLNYLGSVRTIVGNLSTAQASIIGDEAWDYISEALYDFSDIAYLISEGETDITQSELESTVTVFMGKLGAYADLDDVMDAVMTFSELGYSDMAMGVIENLSGDQLTELSENREDYEDLVGITFLGAGGDNFTADDGDMLTVFSGAGNDRISFIKTTTDDDKYALGGDGNDTLIGGRFSNDLLSGGKGGDRLQGQEGNDTLRGQAGADQMDGGKGDDTIYWEASDLGVIGGSGFDTIVMEETVNRFDLNKKKMRGIDGLDMSDDTGNDRAVIDFRDILSATDKGVLQILGDEGDSVVLKGKFTRGEDVTRDDHDFASFALGKVVVYVEIGLTVNDQVIA